MKRASKCVLGAAVLLLLGETICSANLISYSTWPARRDKLMVMDENGDNPVEVFVMSKGSFPGGGSVSPADPADPADPDETWILFNDLENIYKIRPNGTNQTLVLCAPGTTHPYGLGDPIWSPDGSEILVTPYDEFHPPFLALTPANHTAGENCSNDWTPIYEFSSPWGLEWGPAWSHDGSRIAFTEWNEETEESHLVVIERQASGAWDRIDPPIPVHPDFSSVGLSWRPQAGSGLLIFRQRDDYLEPGVCCWLGSVDLETDTGDWKYVLDGGNPIPMHVGSRPKWSPDGEKILYTDPEGDLVIWNYVNGSRRTVGSGTFADWQRYLVVSSCEGPEDCDDFNDCTVETCNSGECLFADEADGTPCGEYSFCRSGSCFDAGCGYLDLPICDDEDDCTVDSCVDYQCSYEFDSSIEGCSGGIPGDPCTTGADCISGLCHPRKLTCK